MIDTPTLTETDDILTLTDDRADMSPERADELIRSITAVIPEDIISRFDSLAHIQEMIQWEMGDLTDTIWQAVQAAGLSCSFMDTCYFVSVRFLRRQRSANTVKAWALTARRYPLHERERLHYQDLPFSHFSYAAKGKFGEATRGDILEYSYSESRAQGYNVTVAALEEEFEGRVRTKADYPLREIEEDGLASEFMTALQALTALAEKLSGNPQVLSLIRQGLSLLRSAVDQLSQGELNEKDKSI